MKALDEIPEAWRLAMQREKDSGEFYARMAQSASDKAVRSLFEMLHAQEREHYALLEGEYRRLFEPDLELGKERLPLTWYEWDEDSFRLAEALDLPVMLYITAPWCEPCHLMERSTLADPEVVDAINDSVIPILVDADRRPDVDERYALGGWPTTAFLDANGDVVESHNFLTSEEMLMVLDRVRDRAQGTPETAQPVIAARPGVPAIEVEEHPTAVGDLSVDVVQAILDRIVVDFDEQHGGLAGTPKFHHADVLEFVLAIAHRGGDPGLAHVVNKSLESMAQSSLYDKEGGGFFRYAAHTDWSGPHFEKMAEDQADLARLYLQAYRATGDAAYLDTARGVLRYVDEVLWDRDRGYFYSSQEADPDYYRLDAAERRQVDAPFVDKTIYTARNAAVASAYMLASAVLDEPRYADLAVRALEYVWSHLYRTGLGMHHYYDDQPHVPGLLTDQVAMAHAWLDAYEHFGREVYLEHARTLMRFTDNALRDGPEYPSSGDARYFDTLPAPEALGRLRQRNKPFCGNVLAAEANLRLSRLTGRDDYRTVAQHTLQALIPYWPGAGYDAARFALAVDRFLRRPLLVTVVGENEDPLRDALIRAARRTYAPNKTIQAVDPRWEADRLQRLGYPPQPSPAAYVCLGNLCARPTSDPDEVVAQAHAMVGQDRTGVRRGWEYQGYSVDEGFKPEPRERFQYFLRVFRGDERLFRYCIWTSRQAVEGRWPGIDVTTEAGRQALEERLREEGHTRVRNKIDAGQFENWLLDLRASDEEELILEEKDE